MSTTLNFGKSVDLNQAAKLILSVPENIFFLRGEPGIGKSTILDFLEAQLPSHIIADPIDVPTLDLGDTAMPVVDREKMLTNYAPNSRFKLTQGKPVVIMLDEFTKGAEPVKNMLHPLFETRRRRLGDVYLPEGSIVYLTGNLATDGVGDSFKSHTLNRISEIRVRKPDADQWLNWAANNNIAGLIMAWVQQFPHSLASYMDDGAKDNPYIFDPRAVQKSFVSPRSLERASNIVNAREHFDSDALICSLTGTVGESAARDIQAFVEYQDQLPSWASILQDPKRATVPESAGACAVMVFGAISKIDKQTIPKFMTYLERFEAEWQACFAINVARNPSKQNIAFSSKAFADWVQKNEDLL